MELYSDLNAHLRTLRKLKSILLGLLRRIRYKNVIKREKVLLSLFQIKLPYELLFSTMFQKHTRMKIIPSFGVIFFL